MEQRTGTVSTVSEKTPPCRAGCFPWNVTVKQAQRDKTSGYVTLTVHKSVNSVFRVNGRTLPINLESFCMHGLTEKKEGNQNKALFSPFIFVLDHSGIGFSIHSNSKSGV